MVKLIQAPPGLQARVAWAAQQTGSPPGASKNVFCPRYKTCLDAAAYHKPHLDFACLGCRHEADRVDLRPDDIELAGLVALLRVIFGRAPHQVDRIVRDVQSRLGEYLALIAGERPRQQDQPHWYSLA